VRIESWQQWCQVDISYPHGCIQLVFFVFQTEEFAAWLDALKDKRAQIRIAARLR
jgi:hypothetical protein